MTTRDRIAEILVRHGATTVFPQPTAESIVDELEQLMLSAGPSEVFRQQLRLRCAEIIFTTGSQEHRGKIELEAERLYQFAIKEPDKKTD